MVWYEDDIRQLENKRAQLKEAPETIFYGSSSIRQWTGLEQEFADWKPVNLGFGGSTLAACDWFFERVMAEYQPKRLVVYAGDNDLGDGRHPEEVFLFFQQLAARTAARFKDIHCYYISLKPSLSRWNLVGQFKYANTLIEREIADHLPNWTFINLFDEMINAAGDYPKKELFLNDGLHLSETGYQLWVQSVKQKLQAEA
jgi:lysophospholipase L1-like esterase